MLERYKLRLRDGTVLVVDHDALSSWLVDGRAMVQPVGSERWVPLKTFVAKERVAARNAAFRRQTPDAHLPLTPPPPTPLPLIPPPPREEARGVRPVRIPPLPAVGEPPSPPPEVPEDAPVPSSEWAPPPSVPEEEVTVPVAEEPEAPPPPPPDAEPLSAAPEPVLSVGEAPSIDVPAEEPTAVYSESPQVPPGADEDVTIAMTVAEEPEASPSALAASAREPPPFESEPIEVWAPSEEAAALSADSFPDSIRRAPAEESPAAPITLLDEEDVTPWRTAPPMRGAPVGQPPFLNPQNLQVLAEETAAPRGGGRQARSESPEEFPIIPLKRFVDEDEASFRAGLQPQAYETYEGGSPEEETPFLESSFLGLSPTWDARLKGWFDRLSRVLDFLGRWLDRARPRDHSVAPARALPPAVRPLAEDHVAPRRAAFGSAAASAIAVAGARARGLVTGLRAATAAWTGRVRAWVDRSTRRSAPWARDSYDAAPAGVGAAPRATLVPPPHISELPVLRLKADDSERERAPHDVYGGRGSFDVAWRWTKRAALIAGFLAGGIVAAGTWETWVPAAARFGRAIIMEIDKRAHPSAPGRGEERARPGGDALPAAVEQLPHLDPQTIALVVSRRGSAVVDPPEVFALAYEATERGLPALTPAETQELSALRRALLAGLSAADRQRLRQYDLLRAQRSPLPLENRDVLRSFARGTRALPSFARLRLQELLGKAIAAALGAPSGEVPRAAAR